MNSTNLGELDRKMEEWMQEYYSDKDIIRVTEKNPIPINMNEFIMWYVQRADDELEFIFPEYDADIKLQKETHKNDIIIRIGAVVHSMAASGYNKDTYKKIIVDKDDDDEDIIKTIKKTKKKIILVDLSSYNPYKSNIQLKYASRSFSSLSWLKHGKWKAALSQLIKDIERSEFTKLFLQESEKHLDENIDLLVDNFKAQLKLFNYLRNLFPGNNVRIDTKILPLFAKKGDLTEMIKINITGENSFGEELVPNANFLDEYSNLGTYEIKITDIDYIYKITKIDGKKGYNLSLEVKCEV